MCAPIDLWRAGGSRRQISELQQEIQHDADGLAARLDLASFSAHTVASIVARRLVCLSEQIGPLIDLSAGILLQ